MRTFMTLLHAVPLSLALCVAVTSGCGVGTSSHVAATSGTGLPAGVVARVGNTEIAQAALVHDLDVVTGTLFYEFAHYRAPAGLFREPSDTRPCVGVATAIVKRAVAAGKHGTPAIGELPGICRMLGRAIEQEALTRKIRGYWLAGQTAELGVTASEGEVGAETYNWEREHFGGRNPARVSRYLRDRDMTVADERREIRSQVLSANLTKQLTQFGGRGAPDRYEETAAPKWTARTLCQPEYAVEACRNFRPSRPLAPSQLLISLSGRPLQSTPR